MKQRKSKCPQMQIKSVQEMIKSWSTTWPTPNPSLSVSYKPEAKGWTPLKCDLTVFSRCLFHRESLFWHTKPLEKIVTCINSYWFLNQKPLRKDTHLSHTFFYSNFTLMMCFQTPCLSSCNCLRKIILLHISGSTPLVILPGLQPRSLPSWSPF